MNPTSSWKAFFDGLLKGKGKFKVRITIRLANGKKISGVRTYHTCIPKLPGDGPPRV